jgi:hypothetical protein
VNRNWVRLVVVVSTLVALSIPALAAPAGAPAGQCKGDVVKARVHAAATRREVMLLKLVAKLQARQDPYALNAGQISALQSAASAITALDQQIQRTCYPTYAALHVDAVKLFVTYRVYWLRVPQTHAIEAADHLAEARQKLGGVAAKLAGLVGSNRQAQTDLAAMNQALTTSDAKLGTPPTPTATIAAIPGLQPALDMTADTQALITARQDLLAARLALSQARDDGAKVITDLRG